MSMSSFAIKVDRPSFENRSPKIMFAFLSVLSPTSGKKSNFDIKRKIVEKKEKRRKNVLTKNVFEKINRFKNLEKRKEIHLCLFCLRKFRIFKQLGSWIQFPIVIFFCNNIILILFFKYQQFVKSFFFFFLLLKVELIKEEMSVVVGTAGSVWTTESQTILNYNES